MLARANFSGQRPRLDSLPDPRITAAASTRSYRRGGSAPRLLAILERCPREVVERPLDPGMVRLPPPLEAGGLTVSLIARVWQPVLSRAWRPVIDVRTRRLVDVSYIPYLVCISTSNSRSVHFPGGLPTVRGSLTERARAGVPVLAVMAQPPSQENGPKPMPGKRCSTTLPTHSIAGSRRWKTQ